VIRDREAGFTLIEMIVVLVVLALAAGLVLARGPMRSASLDLRAAARTMAADMRTTRATAIETDRALLFTLDPVQGDYGVKGGTRHALPRGIAAVTPAAPARQATVLFRADGSASGGRLGLSERDHTIAIDTDWLTGAVTVHDSEAP
jgi:general secretion pathway protein H